MSEAQEIDSPIAKSEENINNSNSTSVPVEDETTKTLSNEKDGETQKSESIEEPKNKDETLNDIKAVPNDDTTKTDNKSSMRDESIVLAKAPTSPTSNTPERNKAGECNLLPVLVERLRSALEQSCSSPSGVTADAARPEDSAIESEEDLRAWASGLCSSMEQQRDRLNTNDLQSSRGLKLDLKFLEDLLLSDIQTALGRLQETLVRVDIGTLTRYSSTLDPTNKLNLLKLISSLLANLKIPEESIAKPEKTSKTSSGAPRRRRTDRHTIGVTSDDLARARKWLEEKNVVGNITEPVNDASISHREIETGRNLESDNRRENSESVSKENTMDRLDSQCHENKQYEIVPEKYMKDALNQQQSLQNKSVKDTARETIFQEQSANGSGAKLTDSTYKDDNTIINEEYGLSASSLYHQSNAQTKCNKYLAKKSKIKRANTIDIPNYLKLQAENFVNGNGVGSLRRPINIGDKYAHNGGHVVPSFEPKTENDRKFLALINKNNDATTLPAASCLPFKSFNYRQIASDVDKNWNSRFSNIKTTFDKPRTNDREENVASRGANVVVASPRLPYKQKSPGFSHAPTSPFQKIERPSRDEMTPGFLKPGYLPKNGSALKAKVKMFDQENVESTTCPNSPLPTRTHTKQHPNSRKVSNFLHDAEQRGVPSFTEKSRGPENGNLNYHNFCKQFAPFATKNPTDHPKCGSWLNSNVNDESKARLQDKVREKFKALEERNSNEEYKGDHKVPVAYRSANFHDTARQDKSRNRKLYDCFDVNENETNLQDIVAYPFEINYHKRPTDQKYRDARSEKANFGDDVQQQNGLSSPGPLSSLRYIKSILPSRKTPSPPPRGVSLTQSVAVQTHQTEPISTAYTSDNLDDYSAASESPISRRLVNAGPLAMEIAPHQTRNLPHEEREDNPRTGVSRHHHDNLQRPSCQRDPDSTQFTGCRATNQTQGRQAPSHSTPGHVFHPPNRYPPIADYQSQYYSGSEHENCSTKNNFIGQTTPAQMPAPPQIGIPPISKLPREQDELYDRYAGRSYEEKNRGVSNYRGYSDVDFYRDAKNPIYVPSSRNVEKDPRDFQANSPLDELISAPAVASNPGDLAANYDLDPSRSYFDEAESAEMLKDRSFVQDENIQNQDISMTEGVVTRYACAIATVSPVPESPTISPSPPPLKEKRKHESTMILDENSKSYQCPREHEVPYVATPFYRDEHSRDREETSLEQARRHNLLQQNLIRKLQKEQSEVPTAGRRLSQETSYGDERTSQFRCQMKPEMDQSAVSNVPRKMFPGVAHGDEALRGVLGHPTKLAEDQPNRGVEALIESNNTQDKINIFEERNSDMKKQQQRFKPLSIPQRGRETFVTPKINIVSPSKVFKPSFKRDANIGRFELPCKLPSNVDSSDEYLMSCASKPSRSIVLSKSESWHQLALSKNTLQVPQVQPSALLKPPKPKSPSSLKLSKQYEASSSSDAIRKMEEKIQRYFTGPAGQNDSSLPARKETKSKRNFNSRKSQGNLMRSHTMPHIYDDATDVDKAFDSLFKEAMQIDNRY